MPDNFINLLPGKIKFDLNDPLPDFLINKINSGYFQTFNIENVLFDPTVEIPPFIEGQMFYDKEWKTVAANIDTDVTLQIGQEDLYYVFNNSGVEILDGQPVYVTGSGSDGVNTFTETVSLAKADNLATSKVLGIATQHIPNNSYGFIVSRGKLNGLDTSNMGNEGDILYLSPTVAGGLTNILPEYPNVQISLARLLRKSETNGRISIIVDPLHTQNDFTASIASPLYLIPTTSELSASCLSLSYTNTNTPDLSSVTASNNTVLINTYIADTTLGITSIPSGVWNFSVTGYTSSASGETRFLFEIYNYHLDNSTSLLFSVYSPEINNTTLAESIFTYTAESFPVLVTDRLMVKFYATTTRNSATQIYYIMGNGNGPFITPPLKLKHSNLSHFNEDPEIQHLTSTEKTKIINLVTNSGYIEKSANYNILLSDTTINCIANSFNVTLPDATLCNGQVFRIKNSGGGFISILTISNQTVDEGDYTTLSQKNESITLQSTGSNWIII